MVICRTMHKIDTAEAAANVIIGCAINWSVLLGVYGKPLTAGGVTVAMIGVTFLRSYTLRRVFRRIARA